LQVTFNVTNATCFGQHNGQVIAIPSGGMAPYTFMWSNSPSTTATISNLGASYYAVTVVDAMNNQVSDGVNVTEPTMLDLRNYSRSHVTAFENYDGWITLSPSGSVPPYTYSWTDGPGTQNRYNLGGGSYEVLVTDAGGCTSGTSIEIQEPPRNDWSLTGNIGSDANTNYTGTADDEDFVFKTNALERARIMASGDFRITNLADTDSTIRAVYVDMNGNLRASESEEQAAFCQPQLYTKPWYSWSSTQDVWRCSGRVGIGNMPNGAKLIVAGNMKIGGMYSDPGEGITAPTDGLLVQGKVGIGTPTFPPSGNYMLAVNGNIIAEEVKVKLYANWDKVFENDYRLMPLEDLKEFLRIHHHLPDVQSAAEMKQDDGINVGDFQMRLLRKVEELTLYIIQQDKRIEELEKNSEK
jgi:hypothetical protein